MVGFRVLGTDDEGGKAVVASAEAVGLVAGDEDIAGARGFLALLALGDGQRLEIGSVGKEHAGVLGAEGMARVGGDDEAEGGMAGPRGVEILDRKHEVIEGTWGAR